MSQPCNVPEGYVQGDPNRNFLFQIAVSLKRSIFDPSLVKPKCVLGVADFFQFSAVCLQFSAVCLQFPKKSATLQTHFGLYNMGSNIHSFWAMAMFSENIELITWPQCFPINSHLLTNPTFKIWWWSSVEVPVQWKNERIGVILLHLFFISIQMYFFFLQYVYVFRIPNNTCQIVLCSTCQ